MARERDSYVQDVVILLGGFALTVAVSVLSAVAPVGSLAYGWSRIAGTRWFWWMSPPLVMYVVLRLARVFHSDCGLGADMRAVGLMLTLRVLLLYPISLAVSHLHYAVCDLDVYPGIWRQAIESWQCSAGALQALGGVISILGVWLVLRPTVRVTDADLLLLVTTCTVIYQVLTILRNPAPIGMMTLPAAAACVALWLHWRRSAREVCET